MKAGSGKLTGGGDNRIVLYANDTNWDMDGVGDGPGFFVAPVRDDPSGGYVMSYDPDSGEITYDSTARRRLEPAAEARIAELERKLEATVAEAQARNAALEAQVKALAEKLETLLA